MGTRVQVPVGTKLCIYKKKLIFKIPTLNTNLEIENLVDSILIYRL